MAGMSGLKQYHTADLVKELISRSADALLAVRREALGTTVTERPDTRSPQP